MNLEPGVDDDPGQGLDPSWNPFVSFVSLVFFVFQSDLSPQDIRLWGVAPTATLDETKPEHSSRNRRRVAKASAARLFADPRSHGILSNAPVALFSACPEA